MRDWNNHASIMSYSDETRKLLEDAGAVEGSMVVLQADGQTYKGKLMPHHEFSAPDIVILKMKSGYNVGIRVDRDSKLEVVEAPVSHEKREAEVEEKRMVVIGEKNPFEVSERVLDQYYQLYQKLVG